MIVQHNGYDIKPNKETPNCCIIVTSGRGGKIPNILDGMFTTPEYAKRAIDKYLESKIKKDE
jgi:hypothetical protein